ncbi:major facilitator superfamily domain-containing 7, partial [Brachionus plicatilis]
ISISNISNAFNWICYGSIADFTGEFYKISYNSVNFLSLLYLIVSIPSGFISFWLIDTFGIRASINLGAWINFLGSAIKMVSSLDLADAQPLVSDSAKYSVLLVGQSMCALAQPFVLFVSTKFANTWFSEDQRSLANTIALASNTLGVLVGALVSPQIVYSSQEFISEISLLNIVSCLISLVPAIMAGFINRSTPKFPPSFSAIMNSTNAQSERREYVLNEPEEDEESFFSNFKHYLSQIVKLMSSKDFLILFISFGLSLGLFNTLTTLLEQILCTRGYSDTDVGYFGGAMIISGMVGSLIAGVILDKTKRFEEMSKICFCISALANLLFVILQLYNNDNSFIYYLLLISFCLTGFFGLPLLPICMDMAIECVYPIPEAVSTGLLFIAGQVFGIVFILVYPGLAKNVPKDSFIYDNIQTCTKVNVTGYLVNESRLSVLDFNYPLCSYLRLRSEQEKIAEQIFNSVRS